MSLVEVRQIGHVAVTPTVETLSVNGRTQTKTLVTVISNARWKDREGKAREKATAISWTLWGNAAVNAGRYLDVGSKVAIAGTMESRRYPNKEGKEVFGFGFTARSVDYLESRADAEARRNRRTNSPAQQAGNSTRHTSGKSSRSAATAKGA
jgi:single stranded DNA-binding protein